MPFPLGKSLFGFTRITLQPLCLPHSLTLTQSVALSVRACVGAGRSTAHQVPVWLYTHHAAAGRAAHRHPHAPHARGPCAPHHLAPRPTGLGGKYTWLTKATSPPLSLRVSVCLGQLSVVDSEGKRVVAAGRYRVAFGLDRASLDFSLTGANTFL
jgi:hypothetical protein